MDLFLALGLIHVMGGLIWAATVLVLALILLAATRDDGAVLRALPEVAQINRRVLRPAIMATTLTGVVLARAGGLGAEAWVVLSTALAIAALVAGAKVVVPSCERALRMPVQAIPDEGRRALRLARLDLGAQFLAVGLMVLTPGWGGAAILGGLVVCLILAVALVRETDADASPA